jgi:hypothetical protein
MWDPAATAGTAVPWITPTSLCFLVLPQILLLSSHRIVNWTRSLWSRQLPQSSTRAVHYSFVPTDATPASPGFNQSPVMRPRVRNAALDNPPYLGAFLVLIHPVLAAILLRAPDWQSLGPFIAWISISAALALLGRPAVPSCTKFDIPFLMILILPIIFCTRQTQGLAFMRDEQYMFAPHFPVLSLFRLSAFNLTLISFLVLRGFDRIGTLWDVDKAAMVRFIFALLCFVSFSGALVGYALHLRRISFFNGLGAFVIIMFLISVPQTVFFQGVIQELISRTFEMESTRVEFSEDDEDFITLAKPSPRRKIRFPEIISHQPLLRSPVVMEPKEDTEPSWKIRFTEWFSLPSWQEWIANCISSLMFAFLVSLQPFQHNCGTNLEPRCWIMERLDQRC